MKASVRFVFMQLAMAALLGLLSIFQGCSGNRQAGTAGGHAAVRVTSQAVAGDSLGGQR